MVTFEDLTEEYWICRRGKRTSYDMSTLEMEWIKKLLRLRDGINSRTWKPGQSACFVLTFPVPREVVAAENVDRVVHQYIDSRLRPLLESIVFHQRAFSCIKGRGTLYGIKTLAEDIRMESATVCLLEDPTDPEAERSRPIGIMPYTRDCWVLHLDIKSCFMSIPRASVYQQVDLFITEHYHKEDKEDLRYVCRECILNNPGENCRLISPEWMWRKVPQGKSFRTAEPGKGLGIGNLFVQLFFCMYVSGIDDKFDVHFIPRHGRYTDDWYAVSHDKSRLLSFVPIFRQGLKDLGLRMNERKFWLQHYSKGLQFTGAVAKPGRTYISRRTLGGLADSVERLNTIAKETSPEDPDEESLDAMERAASSINAYCGMTVHHAAYHLRRKILSALIPEALRFASIHKDYEGVRIRKQYRKRTRILAMIESGEW